MILNVGCGEDPSGDIRLDVVKKYRPNSTVNFIADARFLPFQSQVFEKVRCHEVLEHIEEWYQALSECCRVSKKEISITVPMWADSIRLRWINLFNPILTRKAMHGIKSMRYQHKWQFTEEILRQAMRRLNFKVILSEHIYAVYPWLKFLTSRKIHRTFQWLTDCRGFQKPMRWHLIGLRNGSNQYDYAQEMEKKRIRLEKKLSRLQKKYGGRIIASTVFTESKGKGSKLYLSKRAKKTENE